MTPKLALATERNESIMNNLDNKAETVHEAVGVFNDADSLQAAIKSETIQELHKKIPNHFKFIQSLNIYLKYKLICL
jgi:hypothetical protein